MQCKQCGMDFTEERKSAKFCSAKCRVYYSRKYPKLFRAIMVDVVESHGFPDSVADEVIEHMGSVVETPKKRVKGPLTTDYCSKHKGYKFRCGCK